MVHEIELNGRTFSTQQGVNDRFWRRVARGKWEPDTLAIFDTYVDSETLVIDVGAWIGPTVLYAAPRAANCVGFEPDKIAYAELNANLELNKRQPWAKNVKIYDDAIHPSGEPIVIGSNGEGGDSMTSALLQNRENNWTVNTQRLQDVIARDRGSAKKVFVKVDIEGGEYELVPDIKEILTAPDHTFLIALHHRRLWKSIKQRHNSDPKWRDELIATLTTLVNALPWDREILAHDNSVLTREDLMTHVVKGDFPTDSLIIR